MPESGLKESPIQSRRAWCSVSERMAWARMPTGWAQERASSTTAPAPSA